LANYRFHFNDWNGIEANYAYTKFSQYYTPGFTAQAQANEFTVAYVNNLGRPAKAKIRPFVEAGTGLLIFSPVPAGSTTNGTRQDRAVFLFGGGVDWHIKRNISVRLGFRDLIYTAPDFAVGVQVTKAATQMPEPYAGIAFRF
jgi:opacity protein-like surface antigen